VLISPPVSPSPFKERGRIKKRGLTPSWTPNGEKRENEKNIITSFDYRNSAAECLRYTNHSASSDYCTSDHHSTSSDYCTTYTRGRT